LEIGKVGLYLGIQTFGLDSGIPEGLRMGTALRIYENDGSDVDDSLTDDGEPKWPLS
jgi:hypothetical protein